MNRSKFVCRLVSVGVVFVRGILESGKTWMRLLEQKFTIFLTSKQQHDILNNSTNIYERRNWGLGHCLGLDVGVVTTSN